MLKIIFKAPEEKSVSKSVVSINNVDQDVESHIKKAMDYARTGDAVRKAMHTAFPDAMTRNSVVETLVAAFKSYEGYRRHMTACIAPLAKCTIPKYTINEL